MKATRVKAVDTERLAPVSTLRVDGLRYRFMHQMGVGAFTTVYKATDEWGNDLAVKVYLPKVATTLWQNEVQQLRRFAGPSVVYLHRVFMHEEHAYLVLDNAGIAISRCSFDSESSRIKVVMLVAKGLLQALVRLHADQHFHGDINPQNVLLRSDNQQKLQAVNLVDFAMCRSQQKLNRGLEQMAHWAPPPEYFKKAPLLGSALDIWHVGVLLLQTLKGETLDYTQADVLAQKPRADALAMQHPMGLVLATALESDPNKRPDALSLWRALRECLRP
jgi:serine/threonine protein kinase